MKNIFITRNLFPEAIERLARFAEIDIWPEASSPSPEVLISKAAEVDGLITMLNDPIDTRVVEAGHRNHLQVISQMAVGFDNIDVASATKFGILVGNTPGVLSETTADLAWALLMAAARRIVESHNEVHRGIWRPWGPDVLCGVDIYGATLGLIGFGRIGQAMAARARGFNMQVLYTQRHRNLEAESRLGATFVSLEDLLRRSDFISLHAYLSAETKGMIGKSQFEMMKPGVILINTARGAMIDHAALNEYLMNGKVAAAALDVTNPEPIPQDSPLLALPNVIVTPHIGSASIQTRKRMAMMTVENIEAGLSGNPLPYCVNPEVYTKRK